jgi:hypothetical protein
MKKASCLALSAVKPGRTMLASNDAAKEPLMPKIPVLLTLLLLTGCAAKGDLAGREADELALYQQHAGGAVERIQTFTGIDRWHRIDDRHVVVWTGVNRAWLLELRVACPGLAFQDVIRISSSNGVVTRRFDALEFRHERCPIETIRPVDYKALRRQRGE